MPSTIQIKRRVSGASGSPASLKSGEMAHNEVSNVLYIGKGDDGSGNATSIVPIGGSGSFAPLASPTFTGTPTAPTASPGTNTTQLATTAFVQAAVTAGSVESLGAIGDVTITTPADNEVLAYDTASGDWINQTPAEAGLAAASHTHPISAITSLQTTLDAKAPLASPTFTGVPAVPTATAGTNTTQIASTAFVQTAVNAVVGAAPGTLNTLNELAAALGDNPNFATTTAAQIAAKLTANANLLDLTNAATARTNLGLGTMATQNAASVNITGGTVDGVTIDGGTF